MQQSAFSYSQRVQELADVLCHKLADIDGLAASTAGDILYDGLAAALDNCLDGLRALDIWGSNNRLLSSELWNIAGHFLSRGWLLNQARTKPRGYAGDYELLARIYHNRLVDDPLGRLLDRYFQLQAAPQAVRNRMAMMTDWIIGAARTIPLLLGEGGWRSQPGKGPKDSVNIVVLGSAFGLEVRDALLRLDEVARGRLRITLLDLDPASIDFARDQLAPLVPADRLTALSTNIFRLPHRAPMAELLRGTNLLFCPGLFDYLDDAAAAAMLRCLFEQLAPGGSLTVFQFAPHNPTRTYMEWFGNWYLTYRDAGQFQCLVDSAGLSGASVTFGAEPLGIDLFMAIVKAV